MNDLGREDTISQSAAAQSAPSLIEAILLVSPRPVPLQVLLSATGLSETEARVAIGELKNRYSIQYSGIVLREVAGGLQLATNPSCAAAVEQFRKEDRPAPLSGAAYEVLSCILYLGPLTRAGITAARGVNSDAVVRNLLNRNLVVESSRDRESPGTPAVLDVTEDFLLAAGAKSRDDFPALEDVIDPEEISSVRERINGRSRGPQDGGEEE